MFITDVEKKKARQKCNSQWKWKSQQKSKSKVEMPVTLAENRKWPLMVESQGRVGEGVNVGGARRKEKVESGMKLIYQYKFINKNLVMYLDDLWRK